MTLDLNTYEHFMTTLKQDVSDVLKIARRVNTKYDDGQSKSYLDMLAS